LNPESQKGIRVEMESERMEGAEGEDEEKRNVRRGGYKER